MKLCSGSYIKLGISEHILSHAPIVFEEQAVPHGECPLCYEKAWHEDTAKDLRNTEEEIGKLKAILIDAKMEHLIP